MKLKINGEEINNNYANGFNTELKVLGGTVLCGLSMTGATSFLPYATGLMIAKSIMVGTSFIVALLTVSIMVKGLKRIIGNQ